VEQKIKEQLLDLLGEALWNVPCDCQNLTPEEWGQMYECAEKQSVVPLMLRGAAPYKTQIPLELLNRMRSCSISVVMRNERLMAIQDQLMAFMTEHHIPCAILKGCSLSVCYPQAELRPLGDIDVLIRPEDVERTEQLLCANGYRPDHTGHPFHLDFFGKGACVEMHWQVSTFPDSQGGHTAREIMQTALEQTDIACLEGYSFPELKPLHQAISLLLHMERHMTTGGIGLRQLCDWAMFVNSVDAGVFAAQVLPKIEKCGLLQFAKVLTATCVEYLAMPAEKGVWCQMIKPAMCAAMMQDVFRGGSMGKAAEETEVSGMFIERGNAGRQRNAVLLMFQKLTQIANVHFPITRCWKMLLPVFWIYIPLRYWVRSLQGKRTKIAFADTLAVTRARRKLYNELRLFETGKGH